MDVIQRQNDALRKKLFEKNVEGVETIDCEVHDILQSNKDMDDIEFLHTMPMPIPIKSEAEISLVTGNFDDDFNISSNDHSDHSIHCQTDSVSGSAKQCQNNLDVSVRVCEYNQLSSYTIFSISLLTG